METLDLELVVQKYGGSWDLRLCLKWGQALPCGVCLTFVVSVRTELNERTARWCLEGWKTGHCGCRSPRAGGYFSGCLEYPFSAPQSQGDS